MPQFRIINEVLRELTDVLRQIKDTEYVLPSAHLSGATIGQHTRHIIELFQCLHTGYNDGIVNYEKRKRDIFIETDRETAVRCIEDVLGHMGKTDKYITIEAGFASGGVISVNSSYQRELIYNLEHAIHHMALIRIGINELTAITLPQTFGIAPSTIEYRKKCVQ